MNDPTFKPQCRHRVKVGPNTYHCVFRRGHVAEGILHGFGRLALSDLSAALAEVRRLKRKLRGGGR